MQKLFMQTALAALADAGYADERPFDRQRTAVLLGGAAGCQETVWAGLFRPNALRARCHLSRCESAAALGLKGEALEELLAHVEHELISYPPLSEDSLLAICVQIGAARFAKAMDLMGAHCNIDAACGSSLASVVLAVRGLQIGKWDVVVVGESQKV
jgi:acyl transferase domain-containing protein